MSIELQPRSFTLDTNCLIDLAEDRPAAVHVRALLAAANHGKADLAMVASSASERQSSEEFLQNMDTFNERRGGLGLGGITLLLSIARWDVSFFDHGLHASIEGSAREQAIYNVLFPNSPHEWAEYAASKEVDTDDIGSPAYLRWRNQMLDAQALWAHDHAGRDVFVTSDVRLRKLNGHPEFPTMTIMTPEQAVLTL